MDSPILQIFDNGVARVVDVLWALSVDVLMMKEVVSALTVAESMLRWRLADICALGCG